MLSRLAESLFWIGRYVERAEDTARILDVHVLTMLEDTAADEELTSRSLLAVMGVPLPPSRVDVRSVTDLLAFDPLTTASIVSSLTAARENARGARDVISSEMFNCLNRSYNALPGEQSLARRQGPSSFFAFVRESGAEFHGLADSTMSRDEGWLFLVLGRSLERVDMATRLLATRVVDQGSTATWVTLLRSFGAYEAYLRSYRNAVDAEKVAEFLLLDRLFPRSVFSSLRRAEQCALELSPAVARVGVNDELTRAIGRVRSRLEYLRPGELTQDLPALLIRLQAAVAEAGEAAASRYFRSASTPTSWLQEVPA